jgi:hypothetical protein
MMDDIKRACPVNIDRFPYVYVSQDVAEAADAEGPDNAYEHVVSDRSPAADPAADAGRMVEQMTRGSNRECGEKC